MTAENTSQLILSALALAFFIAILVALAETKLYPMALGIVVLALVYELMHNPQYGTAWNNLIQSAGSKLA